MATVTERAAELERKRGELNGLFEKHRVAGADGKAAYDFDDALLTEVRGRTEELDRLTDGWIKARDVEEAARKNAEELERLNRAQRPPFATGGGGIGGGFDGMGGHERAGRKTLGQLVVESKAFREYRGGAGPVSSVEIDVKTLMSTSAGYDPEDTRTGKVLLSALQQPRVVDLVPKTTTKQSTVLYMEETTHTNNAAEAAEAATYGESALAYTERSSEVRKIAVSLPVTDEMMEDTERLQNLIDQRLQFMLQKRLDSQILVGSGTAPNLRGVNNLSGINTQAKGTDPVFDAVYKGIVLIQTTAFEDPDGIVMHPSDWQDIRLTRTADGIYILGSPGDDVAPRLFGLPVIPTTHQTQNTAVVGCWRMHSELAMRRGIEVQISDSHSTYFVEGKKMLRADLRCALIFDRATAFCTVTGI